MLAARYPLPSRHGAGPVMWKDSRFDELELFRASLGRYAYARHFHDTFVVAVGRSTGYRFDCDGRSFTAAPGMIVVINPGEVHDGRSADEEILNYRSMYPRASLLREIASGIDPRYGAAPVFPRRVITDPALFDLLWRAHEGLERRAHGLGAQELLISALSHLVMRHAEKRARLPADNRSPLAIGAARAYLESHASERVTLSAVARVAGLTPFHFTRVFRATLGLPPHQYLMNLRVNRAQAVLSRGGSIAEAAISCGFSDQSHLTRCFKRILGVTPGRYSSKIVQDALATGP